MKQLYKISITDITNTVEHTGYTEHIETQKTQYK